MKRNTLSFTIEPMKPRNRIAEEMFDRAGPYKAKKVKSAVQYQRRAKHQQRQVEY